MVSSEQLIIDLKVIRDNSPLVHNITNYVVMNTTANALLSIGASPVMAHAIEEMEEMVAISSALVINIGTLSEKWIEAMFVAGKAAKKKGIPVILDPVGVGATKLRTETANRIIKEVQPDIIRGNGSEIMALANSGVKTKGVDSTAESSSAVDVAKQIALENDAIVCVSGATDYITNGDQVATVGNGHPLMGKVTGTGCTASAIIGAFAAVVGNYFVATIEAMLAMGIAGEMAANEADAPGSFQVKFLDALYRLGSSKIEEKIISDDR